MAVEEAAVAAEHSNLADEAVLHNKIVVEAVAVVVAAVVVAADSPFQNCYLDPSSLTHRVAAEEVPFPVEVDDSAHWYWLVPCLFINCNCFSRQERYFFPKANTRREFFF